MGKNQASVDRRIRRTTRFWVAIFFVLVGLPMIGWILSEFNLSREILYIFFLCPFSILFVFLGGYAGFGKKKRRWSFAPLGSLAMSCSIAYLVAGREFWIFVIVGVSLTLVVGVCAHFIRVSKGELKVVEAGSKPIEAFQFGIKDMLVFTTVAALFVAFGQFVFSLEDSSSHSAFAYLVFRIAGCVVCLALPLLINFWSFFGDKLTTAKMWFNVMATAFATAGICFVLPGKLWWPMTVVANQILFATLMWTMRMRGIRFVKRVAEI